MEKPYIITADSEVYFCTDVIVDWLYVFTMPDYFQMIIEALQYCQTHKGLRLHGYVVMPNHIHTILSACEMNLSDILRDFKRFTSRQITEMLTLQNKWKILKAFSKAARAAGEGNDFKVWQNGSHPIAVASNKFFEQKLEYLHDNPVRKGYVRQPEDWLYSSASNYVHGDHSLIKVDFLTE